MDDVLVMVSELTGDEARAVLLLLAGEQPEQVARAIGNGVPDLYLS